MAKRADRSRALPQALVIPTVTTLKTLADVCELLRHLPEDRRTRSTWRHVEQRLAGVVVGAGVPADAAISLWLGAYA